MKRRLFCTLFFRFHRMKQAAVHREVRSWERLNIMQSSVSMQALQPGEFGVVRGLLTSGSMRRRLQDIGLVEGTRIECLGRSPGGDPSAYLIRGAVIAIRAEDGRGVLIERGNDQWD